MTACTWQGLVRGGVGGRPPGFDISKALKGCGEGIKESMMGKRARSR